MTPFTDADRMLVCAELPPPRLIAFQSRVFPDGHGVIEYRSTRPAHAPCVIMLHGLGSSAAGYRAQLAGLPALRVIAWNAPGFGQSACLADDTPTAQAYAQALADFATALGIEQVAVLVGSSWGSVIASAFAAHHPERVAALVLSAPNLARGRLAGDERANALAGLLQSGDPHTDRAAVADRLLAKQAPREVRQIVQRLRDAVTPAGWRQAAHMLFSVHTPDLLSRWQGPACVVVGDEDEVAPAPLHAQPLCSAMPRATLCRLPGCGHMPKLEAPSRFNAEVLALAAKAVPQ